MIEFYLFAYADYEAFGGWHDLVGVFDDVESAVEALHDDAMRNKDFAHVVEKQHDLEPFMILSAKRDFRRNTWSWEQAKA